MQNPPSYYRNMLAKQPKPNLHQALCRKIYFRNRVSLPIRKASAKTPDLGIKSAHSAINTCTSSYEFSSNANSNRLTAIDKTTSDTNASGGFELADTALTTNQALNIQSGSNRLLGFAQTLTRVQGTRTLSTTNSQINYVLDANGNLMSDGLRGFEYDAANRLAKVKILKDGEAASIKYFTNGQGQQVFKSEPKSDQLLPDQSELGTGFINWLKTNFGWP